jgi:hypothetical protein
MSSHKIQDVRVSRVIAMDGTSVYFREDVVKRPTKSELLTDRRIEAIQDSQLELTGTFEEIFKVRKREDNINDSFAWHLGVRCFRLE